MSDINKGTKKESCTMALSSVSYKVKFSIKVHTNPGETVFVVGNCPELGDWMPQKAAQLRLESKPKTVLGENESKDDGKEKSDIWSKTIVFSCSSEKKYRYFIGHLLHSDDEEDNYTVIVSKWETNIQPRVFSVTDAVSGKSGEEIAQFGSYGGKTRLSRGWLIDQSHICINLHHNPIKMWNFKTRSHMYSVKCTPIDYRYAHEDEDDDSEASLVPATNSIVTVSVLEKGLSEQRPQYEYGALYTPNCYMSFNVQTLDVEHTGFRLDLYHHSDVSNDSEKDCHPKHVGYGFILPLDHEHSRDSRKIPIYSLKHKPLGDLKFDYLIVKPLLGKEFDMQVSYQNYWKAARKPLDIGHRGMGLSQGSTSPTTKPAPVQENSIQSMKDAASHGADFVEMDVMLTKDKEVVVFHNFQVHISYKMKKDGELELLSIPLHELKLSELQKMKVWHSADPDTNTGSSNEENTALEDEQPFPTLERCLECVDLHTGFQIELKYPQGYTDGAHEQKNFTDLNEFVDRILHTVFKHHGKRRIIFSCFDPDVCIALSLKQNRYPVLFLTQANTTTYTHYEGIRTQSVQIATEFCLCYGLLGVNAMSEVLLRDESLIQYVKDSGLVLFCWGEDNNNFDIINLLKQRNLDGIIYDRIDHFKTSGKESIFKIETKEKARILEKFRHSDSETVNVNNT